MHVLWLRTIFRPDSLALPNVMDPLSGFVLGDTYLKAQKKIYVVPQKYFVLQMYVSGTAMIDGNV
jgi:hypothetical protein